MKITVSAGNRITIPKQLCNQLNINPGDSLDIIVDRDSLVLNKVNRSDDGKVSSNCQTCSTKHARSIVSNLEEGKKFKTKKYSECGLVIRTKTKYLNQFCEDCKGQLALEYGVLDHPCKYNNIPQRVEIENNIEDKKASSKKIINELVKNISKIQTNLDKNINDISKSKSAHIVKSRNKNKLCTTGDTIIQPIYNTEYIRCEGCGEFFNSGFLLDNVFRCKTCTMEDFQKYLNKNKKQKGSN